MLKIGKLVLGVTPRIAVPFKDHAAGRILRQAKRAGLDIAELRIDHYSSFESRHVLKEISKFRQFPTIATIRSKREGGKWNLSEAARLELFRGVSGKVDALDIELSSKQILSKVIKLARKAKITVIVSYHNFDKTPGLKTLSRIAKKAKTAGADIVKIAALAKRQKDVQTLAKFTVENAPLNLITIAMGPHGRLSRVFFPALGSLITYAHLGKKTASGQLSYGETSGFLKTFY
ncbi:MAG: type I 3-dehydroquinate dehydratase [Candidatus Omnitrophica bacterium]|nr:type I 3-dehydroquinate dehydratase [Candidatus Omnitrophota bacterium]